MTQPRTRGQTRALAAQRQQAAAAVLTADARNRALRTFLQGLLLDVVVAVAVVVYTVVTTSGDSIAWGVLGAAVVKTLLTTVASYVMRAKLDPSGVPTPLPPADPGPPADETPELEQATVQTRTDDEPATEVHGLVAQPAEYPPTALIPMRRPYAGVVPQEDGVADHGEDGPRSEAARHARLNEPDV